MTALKEARVLTPPGTTVRRMLRAATADLHATVDTQFSGAFDLDRASYGLFLSALARAVLPLEAAFEAAGVERLLPDWAQRRRGPLLRSDLERLDLWLPGPVTVERPDSEARLFGMLYVLEGSRLGGKLLLRKVLANPDPDVRSATRYLGHGSGRDLWPAFLDRLEASPAVAEAPDLTIAGARDAFTLFMSDATHG